MNSCQLLYWPWAQRQGCSFFRGGGGLRSHGPSRRRPRPLMRAVQGQREARALDTPTLGGARVFVLEYPADQHRGPIGLGQRNQQMPVAGSAIAVDLDNRVGQQMKGERHLGVALVIVAQRGASFAPAVYAAVPHRIFGKQGDDFVDVMTGAPVPSTVARLAVAGLELLDLLDVLQPAQPLLQSFLFHEDFRLHLFTAVSDAVQRRSRDPKTARPRRRC